MVEQAVGRTAVFAAAAVPQTLEVWSGLKKLSLSSPWEHGSQPREYEDGL